MQRLQCSPVLQEGEMRKRNCSVHLRLSEREAEDFRKKAARAGVTIQTYFFWLLYDRPIKEMPPVEYHEVLDYLREINSSLQEIAVKNGTMNASDSECYWENVRELQKTVGKLVEEVYG